MSQDYRPEEKGAWLALRDIALIVPRIFMEGHVARKRFDLDATVSTRLTVVGLAVGCAEKRRERIG